jgi:phage terminase large subunit-like protein
MNPKKDLNALALCFPAPEGVYRFLWYFWLPEETAKAYEHLVPFTRWAQDPTNNLTLTAGSTVHHEVIVKKFAELATKFKIRELMFDDSDAEVATRWMSEGLRDEKGTVLLPGTGVPRTAFPQGLRAFNEPTQFFESLVLSGKLEHTGSDIMDWQAGHASIRTNQDDDIKPVKPGGRNDVKKIDGCIAAVQALASAMHAKPAQVSFYETGHLEVCGGSPSDYDSDGNFKFDRRTPDERRLNIRESSWKEI